MTSLLSVDLSTHLRETALYLSFVLTLLRFWLLYLKSEVEQGNLYVRRHPFYYPGFVPVRC